MISELAIWFKRLVTFLPEIMGLYEAVQRDDEHDKLKSSANLIRAMQNEQAGSEMGP